MNIRLEKTKTILIIYLTILLLLPSIRSFVYKINYKYKQDILDSLIVKKTQRVHGYIETIQYINEKRTVISLIVDELDEYGSKLEIIITPETVVLRQNHFFEGKPIYQEGDHLSIIVKDEIQLTLRNKYEATYINILSNLSEPVYTKKGLSPFFNDYIHNFHHNKNLLLHGFHSFQTLSYLTLV